MSSVEDHALLLEKPTGAEAPISEPHLATPTTCRCLIRRLPYHLKTLYLFSKSDIKTVLVPQTILLLAAILGPEPLTTTSTPDDTTRALRRVPLAIVWMWLNLIVCGVSNQRLPDSVLEDEHNKPWRPIAAGRLTTAQAHTLLLVAIPVVMVASLVLGGFTPTVTMMALLWMYNDLDGSGANVWSRNAINTGGIMCFSAGALEVASGAGELPVRAWWWIALMGAAVMTTVQALDFPDMEGDRARGRQTIPLVCGEEVARGGLAVAVVIWSIACPVFWDVRPVGWAAPVGVGFAMAALTVLRREVKFDGVVAKLWCLWMCALYVLPLFARLGEELVVEGTSAL
ncbi:UbiA prenyltransferase [Colletotrichum sojae]|uniref:UbiA prenyltransferase n=1 Tax=Colletotrichum sojae TaxID=2175907 RepID=A0A8H6JMD7_9PEZI|nr:UbiA prenyltransferase [Colletotrichum sojae]